eukprot:NODE_10_length_47437_cov_0.363429.p10 type:complete len:431 gc:universal NODE_10_length_47437_cov_0.363429:46973-45681(-)
MSWFKNFAAIPPSQKYAAMVENKQNIINGFDPDKRSSIWLEISEASTLDIEAYASILPLQSPFERMIQKDIKRTFPKDLDEDEQTKLFNMLKVFSIFDSNVGYCQGLSFIGGILIKNLKEEESFAVFVQLMNNFQIGSFYAPHMHGLEVMLYQFDCLLEDFLPNIHDYFVKNDIQSNLYASQWFLTMFSYRFPYKIVVRIFDLFLILGIDAIFRISLSILRKNEYTLLSKSFEDLIDYLKHGLLDSYSDVDELIKDALNIPELYIQLQMYEQDHYRMTSSPTVSTKVETPNSKFNSMFSRFRGILSSNDEMEGGTYAELRQEHVELNNRHAELQDLYNITAHSYQDLQAEHEILKACLEELFTINRQDRDLEPLDIPLIKGDDPKDEIIQALEKELLINRQLIANKVEHEKDIDRVVSKIERLLKEAFLK